MLLVLFHDQFQTRLFSNTIKNWLHNSFEQTECSRNELPSKRSMHLWWYALIILESRNVLKVVRATSTLYGDTVVVHVNKKIVMSLWSEIIVNHGWMLCNLMSLWHECLFLSSCVLCYFLTLNHYQFDALFH